MTPVTGHPVANPYNLSLEDEEKLWRSLAPAHASMLLEQLRKDLDRREICDIGRSWARNTWTTADGQVFTPFDKRKLKAPPIDVLL